MPHKKAKKSAREEERRLKGSDLVPHGSHTAIESEPIPKSFARVLNASIVREEYKKRKREGPGVATDPQSGQRKKRKLATKDEPLHLLPGESLTSFNRRVEDNMRPQIRLAVQAGQANARQHDAAEKEEKAARREASEAKGDAKSKEGPKIKNKAESTTASDPASATKAVPKKPADIPLKSSAPKGKTEFESVSSRNPKRLNDIVDAPPDMLALLKKSRVLQKTAESGGVFGKKDIISPEQKRMIEIEREKAIGRYRELKEKRQDVR